MLPLKTKTTNDQINRKVAEIAGKCWHEYTRFEVVAGIHYETCNECGQSIGTSTGKILTGLRMNYASDLNLVHKEELKLVKMGLGEEYITYLHQELGNMWFVNTALADAKTRCLAIIKTCTQVEKEERPSKS